MGIYFHPGNVSSGSTGSGWSTLSDINSDPNTYTNAALVGKSLVDVFLGTARLTTADPIGYSFNSGTGTITWNFDADTGVQIKIYYA